MRISIALCTYNGERHLRPQLESIVAQFRPPDEVVILDDRSEDGTVALAETFQKDSGLPVILEVNQETIGPSRNFDQAIRRCTSDVIVLCDQDDVWAPEKLGRIEMLMERWPQVGFAFGDAHLIDEQGRSVDWRLWDAIGFTPEERWRVRSGGLLPLLMQRRIVTGATMAVRSTLGRAISPIPEIWPHDAWIATVGASVSAYALLPGALMYYRIHPGQHLGIGSRWGQMGTPRRGPLEWRERHRLASERYRCAYRRLSAIGDRDGAFVQRTERGTLELLEELASHREARGGLPESRLRRVPPVLEEWRSRRYRRFGRGSLSALKDLFS